MDIILINEKSGGHMIARLKWPKNINHPLPGDHIRHGFDTYEILSRTYENLYAGYADDRVDWVLNLYVKY